MSDLVLRMLLTGGGTAGHINPALAIASAVRERVPGVEILYVGGARGLENELVPRAGLELTTLEVSGLWRKSPGELAAGLLRAGRALARARHLVRQFRPTVAVGTGGYVSGPVLLAAALAGVPVVLQEQNAVPGATNRWLARWAHTVCVAFDAARPYFPARTRVKVTGNPVRPEVLLATRAGAASELGLDPGRPTLLSTGGSQGARSIATATTRLLAARALPPGAQVVFATGQRYYEEVCRELAAAGIDTENAGNIIVRPYLYRMDLGLAVADLALCRAGAMTVSELAVRGLAAVLVPSPHVAHNEQEYNARVLGQAGAGVVITEREDVGDRVRQVVPDLLADAGLLAEMGRRARALGRPHAAAAIAEAVLEAVRQR